MKKRLTVIKSRVERLGWNQPCGCPLYEQLRRAGFDVKRVDEDDWTDVDGHIHKFHPPFRLDDYIEVLTSGVPFKTKTSDEN